MEMAFGAHPRKICVQFAKYEGKAGFAPEWEEGGTEGNRLESGDSVRLAGVIIILALRNC